MSRPHPGTTRSADAHATADRTAAKETGAATAGASATTATQLIDHCAPLGLVFQPGQADRLLAYLALLQRWNRVYNLTAVRDSVDMLRQHLLDCLAVLPALRTQLAGGPEGLPGPRASARILDVGSGGGLPGVVLAVMEPGWEVRCVDTVAKKASFIRQVAAELPAPNLQALHARVEALQPAALGGGFQVITARAFASLADFTRLTHHLLAPGGVWMAMKGRAPEDEVRALPSNVEVFHVEHLNVPTLDAQRCLVWMRPR